MDRFAEKFPWQSPYVHAGNNPVNYVDVNGDSIYHMDQDGNIFMVDATDDDYDLLYVLDVDGNLIDNIDPLRVNDQSILSQLTKKQDDYNGNYAITESSEIGNVFIYAANNSNVEWGLSGFKNKKYVLSTIHNTGNVTPASNIKGFKEKDMTFKIHSHPGADGTKGASGDFRDSGSGYRGDMANITNMYNRWDKNTPFPLHYVYHAHTKTLYQYTPWNSNIYIRKVNQKNGLNFLLPKKKK